MIIDSFIIEGFLLLLVHRGSVPWKSQKSAISSGNELKKGRIDPFGPPKASSEVENQLFE